VQRSHPSVRLQSLGGLGVVEFSGVGSLGVTGVSGSSRSFLSGWLCLC
jgi:hypothetical protein